MGKRIVSARKNPSTKNSGSEENVCPSPHPEVALKVSVLHKFLSPSAALIAGLLVVFDFVLHQLPVPFAVVEEPLPYYLLKFVAFYLAALFVLLTPLCKTQVLGPFAIGALGAIFVGVAYYFVTFVPLGQRTIGGQLLWGLLHGAMGFIVAGVVLRRPVAVLWGAIALSAVLGAGFVFEGLLAATPSAAGPGY